MGARLRRRRSGGCSAPGPSRHPVWCAWQVTYRCNFRCRFCHYWHDPLGGAAPSRPSPAYADGARQAGRAGHAAGQPGRRRAAAADGPAARSSRPSGAIHFPFVTTNGWFVTPQLARDLMRRRAVGRLGQHRLRRPRTATTARRGMAGALGAGLAGRGAARRPPAVHKWQRVNVIAVLMDDNLDDIEPLLPDGRRGAAPTSWSSPTGSCKTGSRRLRPQRRAGRAAPAGPARPATATSCPTRYYLARFDELLHGGVPGCRAGRAFFNIDSTGDVAICVEQRGRPVANLYRDDVGTIIRRLRSRPPAATPAPTAGTTAAARSRACITREVW